MRSSRRAAAGDIRARIGDVGRLDGDGDVVARAEIGGEQRHVGRRWRALVVGIVPAASILSTPSLKAFDLPAIGGIPTLPRATRAPAWYSPELP
ncbi:MAG: hypothetical protein ACXWPI_18150, partial [Ktedonobacterales bacterium]